MSAMSLSTTYLSTVLSRFRYASESYMGCQYISLNFVTVKLHVEWHMIHLQLEAELLNPLNMSQWIL